MKQKCQPVVLDEKLNDYRGDGYSVWEPWRSTQNFMAIYPKLVGIFQSEAADWPTNQQALPHVEPYYEHG